MVPLNPESSLSQPPARAKQGIVPPRASPGESRIEDEYGRLAVWAIAAGLVGGIGAWLAGEVIHGRYHSDMILKLKIVGNRLFRDAPRNLVVDLKTFALPQTACSVAIGADHLATGARAQPPVYRHADRILDESHAAVAESEIRPARGGCCWH
jgi:hypothetical protein